MNTTINVIRRTVSSSSNKSSDIKYLFAPQRAPIYTTLISGSNEECKIPIHRIYCIGRNYWDHGIEMGGNPSREPPFFFAKPADAAVDTYTSTHKKTICTDSSTVSCIDGEWAAIPYPSFSKNFHYEAELVVVLGKGGRYIESIEKAMECVYGYGMGIDLTCRDVQAIAKKMSRPWETGKSFDKSAPAGLITPADQIPIKELYEKEMILKVNGEIKQRTLLNKMIWNIGEQIMNLSEFFELKEGDVIMTGTPAGVGALNIGDKVEAYVDGIDPCKIIITQS